MVLDSRSRFRRTGDTGPKLGMLVGHEVMVLLSGCDYPWEPASSMPVLIADIPLEVAVSHQDLKLDVESSIHICPTQGQPESFQGELLILTVDKIP